jgi:hypothetical protein
VLISPDSASINDRKPSLMTDMSEAIINTVNAEKCRPGGLQFKRSYDRKSASEQMSEVEEARRDTEKDK